jgi:hypothetical protein
MSDSEEPKTETTAMEIAVVHPDGTSSLRLKDSKGRFMKKDRPLPSGKELTRFGRDLLIRAEAGPDGKVIKGTKTRHRKIFDNLVRIATLETDDPKSLMSIIKAAELLYLRFYGKPSASDEEIEALKTSGVKVILVQPPKLMHDDFKEDHKEPEFLLAEILDDKKDEKK